MENGSTLQQRAKTAHGSPLLVGRDHELLQLQRYWDKARIGTRQIVFVSGEPGIGKTALVDSFVARLREYPEVVITSGQCVEQYGAGEPYLPLLEATTNLCRGPAGEQCLAALRRYAPTWLAHLPGLLSPEDRLSLPQRVQGTNRERMLREMAETAEQFTQAHGVVVVLEDLHWSDVATLDWLTYIARRREPAKLMIIGTYRPADVLVSNHPLRPLVQELLVRQQCEEMCLNPLGAEAITAYVTTRFGTGAAPDVLTTTLARRTGGNPLFLVNTVDYLLAQGMVVDKAGSWTLADDKLTEVAGEIPDTLRQLIERQLERLSEEDWRALEVASIVGVEFSAAEVAAGLPGSVDVLETCCERLSHAGQFLRSSGVEEWPDGTLSGRYSFLHAMYQEVISTRVGSPRRIQLHRRIAERKEAAYGERTREVAAQLAVHFEHGRQYLKAVHYRRLAGEAAARSVAPQDALYHFKRGLELLPLIADTSARIQHEVRLQLALTNPLYAIGGKTALDEMETAYLRAFELCSDLGEPPQLASVLFGLGMVYELRGDLQKGLQLAEQLLALARKSQNPALLLRAHMALGNGSYFLGEFVTSQRHLEHGLAIYEPDKHSPHVSNVAQDLGVVCYARAGWVLWCRGYPDQARVSCDRGVTLARKLSHDLSEAFALDGAIGVAQECGDIAQVEQHVTRLLTLSHEQGFAYPHAWGMMVQGWLLARQGQAEEGIKRLCEGLAAIHLGGQDLGAAYFMALLAETYGAAGRIQEGLDVLAEALTIGQQYGERFYDAELYRLQGELTCQQFGVWSSTFGVETSPTSNVQSSTSDDRDARSQTPAPVREAEACFVKAREIARRQQAKSFELRAAMSLARLWQSQGKGEEARTVLQEVYDWFTEGFETRDLVDAKALLVTLGGHTGKQQKTNEQPLEYVPSAQVHASTVVQSSSLSRSLTSSLVGREAELTRLWQLLNSARNGVRHAVFLSGEPGIGKTAVVDAFLSAVKTTSAFRTGRAILEPNDSLSSTADIWFAHGQCVEQYGAGEPYLPVLEALGRLGREPGKDEVATILAQYAPTWLAQLPALIPAARREELQRELANATRVRMLRELAEAIEVLSAQRLLILVIEDLHWSDPSTVELLAYLLRRPGRAHVLILGTYRPAEVLATEHPLKRVVQELQGRGHCEVLPLELLPEAAVGTYLHQQFGEVPSDFVRALYQRTDGNPLFMVATVEYLLREEILIPDGAQWRITQDLPTLQLEVPENLRQLITTQFERLSPEEQHLLEVASVAGAMFTVVTLVSELEQSYDRLEEHCASLATRRQFLQAAGIEQFADGVKSGRYGFVHALYQRVIYERTAEARRMQLHCRIGERKELLAGERAAELANELATHFEAGGDSSRAVRYLALAGDTATRRQAYPEAIRHLSKGLALLRSLAETPERAQQELTMCVALGIPLIATQGWAAPTVAQVYSRAFALCQQLGTTTQLFSVLRGLQVGALSRAEYATARDLAQQSLDLAQQMRDPALLVLAHMALGQTLFFIGDFVSAQTHCDQALALCSADYEYESRTWGHPGISSLGYKAWILWFLGYPDQALKLGDEAVTWARDNSQAFTLSLALQFASKIHYVRRDAQMALAWTEENIALATAHGFTSFVALETFMRGWACAAQGNTDEGLAQMLPMLSAWRSAGMTFVCTYMLAVLAEVYGIMEQPAQGLQALAEAFELLERTDERFYEAELHRLRGELTCQQFGVWSSTFGVETSPTSNVQSSTSDDRDARSQTPAPVREAEACFVKAREIARRQQAKSFELRAAMSLARLWQSQGKGEEARTVLQEVYDWFTEGFETRDLVDAKELLVTLGGTGESLTSNAQRPEKQEARDWELGAREEKSSEPSAQSLAPKMSTPQAVASPVATSPLSSLSTFRSEGEYWTVVFHGTTARLKDTRGMQHLASLLQRPHQEFSALVLAADAPDLEAQTLAATGLMSEHRDPTLANVHVSSFTDAGEMIDPRAKAEYRQRLKELEVELDEARQFNDVGRIEKLQDELAFLTQELVGAVGLRGRVRKAASPQERARVNVTRAIRTAISRIAEVNPALGQYLSQTIKTGTFCAYVPSPHASVTWEF